jgi:hypothetical protein
MKIRYLILITTMAFSGFSVSAVAHPCDREPGHKHCDQGPGGGDGDSIVYTAKLTGAFAFNTLENDENIVAVTPNKRGSSLHGETLDISIPGYNSEEDSTDCERIADQDTYDACMT